ncbi:hypothetical protein RD792_015825 [Penstemon davidsonii]|uniref:Transcription factor GAMYB n=1 Tax=Penstemon davidsonii TaxID=160366 RepID=A0ABR0CIW4_9LAMI|nr:hypothetical protein RD792_015825 [Penstemon davidsonii]
MVHSFTNESEDGVLSADSPPCNNGDNFVLKKGPWTSAEDAILVDYVKKHGEGNWNAIQKQSGLSRCGKSCRLRWANHLRPNLKKGAFTSEEERLIIELHARMGNKWARMAAHLPGRTDNEIKNYWNTRIKRLQRAGLPLYPPELCPQSESENHLSSPGICGGGNKGCHDIMQNSGYEKHDFIFGTLNNLPYTPELTDSTPNGSLANGFCCPQFFHFVPQTKGLWKHAQELDEPMSDYVGGAAYEATPFDRAQKESCENKIFQCFGMCYPYDHGHIKKLLPFGVNDDSHFMPNGIFSASKPFVGAVKLELPSLQYPETGFGFWDPAPDSLDSFVQSPPSEPLPSHCPSPRSSGLLQALLYEAKALSKSDNEIFDKSTSPNISPGYTTGGSTLETCSTEFKGYLEPTSPSNNQTRPIFSGCIPTEAIRSSFDAMIPVPHVKSEVVEESWIMDGERKLNYSRPDAILGSCWFEQSSSPRKKQRSVVTDAVAALLGDDMGWGLSSCNWNNMPAVCQMTDLP